MSDSLINCSIYLAVWFAAVAAAKFVFKIEPLILSPALACFILYAVGILFSSATVGKNQSLLFTIWNILFILIFGLVAFLVWVRLPHRPFLLSLVFQIPFVIFLWYYGGLVFTHKFD